MAEYRETHQEIADILQVVQEREAQERVVEIEDVTVQLVIILLEGKHYAFYGREIKEIVTVSEIVYVPGMPDYIPGVINVRGEIESVLDLRQLLGLSPARLTKQSRVIIGEIDDIRSGLLVDSVVDVADIAEDWLSVPASSLNSRQETYIMEEGDYNGDELIILDLRKIFEELLRD